MIPYILLVICACAQASGPPGYMDSAGQIQKATEVLHEKLLSMAANVPLLNDSRRHYAAIVQVIGAQADNLMGCLKKDYDLVYPVVLNSTAVMGITEPHRVIEKLQDFLEEIMNRTDEIQSLIEKHCKQFKPKQCDLIVEWVIDDYPEKYSTQAKILVAAGEVAEHFLELKSDFEAAAANHAALKYVVEGQKRLKALVRSTTTLKNMLKNTVCA